MYSQEIFNAETEMKETERTGHLPGHKEGKKIYRLHRQFTALDENSVEFRGEAREALGNEVWPGATTVPGRSEWVALEKHGRPTGDWGYEVLETATLSPRC